jgi:mono/diheme cytochrome c family protein
MTVSLARSSLRFVSGVALAAALVGGCGDGGGDELATRGRQVYLAQCIQCHNANPALDGPVGPAVKGASRELLEAKVLRGEYPAGYRPKRPTRVMPPQPTLAPDIPALAAYLK